MWVRDIATRLETTIHSRSNMSKHKRFVLPSSAELNVGQLQLFLKNNIQ